MGKKEYKIKMCGSFVQMLVAIGFVVYISVAYIMQLWSQNLLNQVSASWLQNPMLDIQFVPVDMTTYRTNPGDFVLPECPSPEYQYALSVTFPGLKEGCNCAGQKTGLFVKEFPELRTGSCNKNETEAGCVTVDKIKEQDMWVIHENVMCVKKEPKLNYVNMDRPYRVEDTTKDPSTQVYCPAGSKFCGSTKEFGEYQLCIPEGTPCPIVNIQFKATNDTTKLNSTLIKETKTDKLLPLIAFELSQYGLPCIFPDEQNSFPEKEDYLLLYENYNDGCVSSIDDDYYSQLFRNVSTFPNISEYTLWDDNNNLLDPFFSLPGFNVDALHKWTYSLYQMSYPHWKLDCYGMEDGFPVQPLHVIEIIAESKSISRYVWATFALAVALAALAFFSAAIYFLRKEKCLKGKTVKKCSVGRFVLTILTAFTCALFVFFMFTVVDLDTSRYLAEKECSSSDLLNNAFVKMFNYFRNVAIKNWISFIFLFLIVFCDIMTSVVNSFATYNKNKDKKKKKKKKKEKDEKEEALLAHQADYYR